MLQRLQRWGMRHTIGLQKNARLQQEVRWPNCRWPTSTTGGRPSSAWLSQLERWFARITERAIRRNAFTSVRALKQQIDLFVQRYDAGASPFKWAATAGSILQKIERIAMRISATGH